MKEILKSKNEVKPQISIEDFCYCCGVSLGFSKLKSVCVDCCNADKVKSKLITLNNSFVLEF